MFVYLVFRVFNAMPRAGALDLAFADFRGLRMSWLIVGTIKSFVNFMM